MVGRGSIGFGIGIAGGGEWLCGVWGWTKEGWLRWEGGWRGRGLWLSALMVWLVGGFRVEDWGG